MRAFIGIPCPALAPIDFSIIGETSKSDFSNLHLTLAFLGNVENAGLEALEERLEELKKIKRFEIELKGISGFPDRRKPRVLWIGIGRGIVELKEAKILLDRCIGDLVPLEKREFHPHATLARIKHITNKPALKAFFEKYADTGFGRFFADRIVLYESRLRPGGAEHIPLKEYFLIK